MKITIQKKAFQTTLQQMALQLGGTVVTDASESQLNIDNAFAKGTIRQYILKNGISYLDYDILFNEDILLSNTTEDQGIYDFIYTSESDFYHSFYGEEKQHLLKFQPAIFFNVPNKDYMYYFLKGKAYRVSMIHVSATSITNMDTSFLMQKLHDIFKASGTKNNFTYLGAFNLKIGDKIQQLKEIDQKGIVRNLITEAIIKTILAFNIEQYFIDLENQNSKVGSLKNGEIERIKKMSECIRMNPENPYTISSISQQSGLSKTKLQEGFRLMYGFTLNNYIKNVRILAAEHLIKTTDLNISEIVYSIGLNSRSYFSKIFREKYNCSPKDYQEHQELTAMSA